MRTPWGWSDLTTPYGPGVVFHSTPSHGGFRVSAPMTYRIPQWIGELTWTGSLEWFEEDCDANLVVYLIPEYFTEEQVANAADSVQRQWPEMFGRLEAWRRHFAHDAEGRCIAPTLFHCPDEPH